VAQISSNRQADKMRRQKLMRYAEIQKRRDGSPSQASKDYATLGVDAANYVGRKMGDAYDQTVKGANYVRDEFGDVVDATGDFVTTAIDTATDDSTPDSRRIASSNIDNSTKTKVSKPKGYRLGN
jgi:predicted lipase